MCSVGCINTEMVHCLINYAIEQYSNSVMPRVEFIESISSDPDKLQYFVNYILEQYSNSALAIKSDFLREILTVAYIKCPIFTLNSQTITMLLRSNKTDDNFFEILHIIIKFANKQNLLIFGVNHMYYLLHSFSVGFVDMDTRKKLVEIGATNLNSLDVTYANIKDNPDKWFADVKRNQDMALIFEWFCETYEFTDLLAMKQIYDDNQIQVTEMAKEFKKINGIGPEIYSVNQMDAKRRGLCRDVRNSKPCSYGSKCNFYHGDIKHTYGIQPCKSGTNCKHYLTNGCKFYHCPTPAQLNVVNGLYSTLNVCRDPQTICKLKEKNPTANEIFFVPKKSGQIDYALRKNPFFVIKKIYESNHCKYYTIPRCEHVHIDIYGNQRICNEDVRFITKMNDENYVPKHYCCYEHMEESEPEANFTIKYNCLDKLPKSSL